MTTVPADVVRLFREVPCEGPYKIKLVGRISESPIYLMVPKENQGCVGLPTFVIVDNGHARYTNDKETAYCMRNFN